MSSGFAKNEAKALQNTTNCATVNLYKRGACVKRAESGLYRPDPKGSAAAVLPEPDLDNANVGTAIGALRKLPMSGGFRFLFFLAERT